MRGLRSSAGVGLAALTWLLACGARSSLPGYGSGGAASSGDAGGATTCADGGVTACGSEVGACKPGTQTCHSGVLGPCEGALGPTPETCNGIDDDCNGTIDDGFHIGEACKGTGTDQCPDGVMTCDGCKKTVPDKVEICNGIDDNCNGIIDADCQAGDCKPTLLVTGSTPSSPNCIDFPVQAGSTGTIEYPCGGGPVTAELGGVSFKGSVTNNYVTLDGWAIVPPGQSPDGCTWQMHHHIEGNIPSGMVSYSYSEAVIMGAPCWQPCTEDGTVQINWVGGP